MTNTASPMLKALASIAYDAGAIVLAHYTDEITATRKQDNSPVTAADVEAERFILKRLAQLAPGVPIVAEEEVAAGRIPKVGKRFFLVDPLDGTKEFVSKNGEFTVNIAEIVEGKPVRGVVYAPAKERIFFGETLSGAFAMTAAPGGAPDFAAAHAIEARPAPKDGLTVAISRTHNDKKSEEYLAAYPVKNFIVAGSSLKFCLIAAGEADIYPRHGRTMEWDTAAGHAVLAAAGGSLTTMEGRPFMYGKAGFANPHFVARGA
ncbi:3'(2'),5'-bisphosphate nucleotidase CysQ [Rhizomicrobium electricum]|jgi:3'(2'), 5'-bisphosphate nucleotidase|uniref:3'(2'),5'-bisphosphate nucleotidase CysQ n=1 Tax=Rhizomicrobium electricum TaxID=480070 RepID=A0ABN1EK67_9PROT|nr:3'(2'),5'-bisphosphate nucleotidase CysQ [Rhizomicrobium electricum]NIJ47142.1 3'(2'), 5'-bisphosphate nucleotidase [Rhizomicrobium electricum]